MSLLTYADARESATRIQEVLLSGTMPPWFADPDVNRFSNDRRLSDAEVRTLLAWVSAGAPEGNPAEAPPPRHFEEGWTIGKPDLVLEMPKPFEIPAKGTLEYQFVVIPLGFTATFTIPPGDPSFRVEAAATLTADVKLTALHPHMHLRGKASEFRMVTPDGERRTLLRVSRYDPMWQLRYHLAEELVLKKGTRLEVTSTFDNSPGNPLNPDPAVPVRWGDQTWDEMALGAFEVVVPRGARPWVLIDRHNR